MIKDKRICEILNHYGYKEQLKYTISELKELEREINLEIYNDITDHFPLIDEIADVFIMCSQLVEAVDGNNLLHERIEFKLARQTQRIEEEKNVLDVSRSKKYKV